MISGCDGEVRPSAHSPTRSSRSSPNVSPTHSYSTISAGVSSSLSATNGFVSNGLDNGYVEEEGNMPMDVEDMDDSPSSGVVNGDSRMEELNGSPRRGENPLFLASCFVFSVIVLLGFFCSVY